MDIFKRNVPEVTFGQHGGTLSRVADLETLQVALSSKCPQGGHWIPTNFPTLLTSMPSRLQGEWINPKPAFMHDTLSTFPLGCTGETAAPVKHWKTRALRNMRCSMWGISIHIYCFIHAWKLNWHRPTTISRRKIQESISACCTLT